MTQVKSTGTDGPSLMVYVGDPSGDKYTAKVLAKLLELMPNLQIWGVGGDEMKQLKMEQLFNTSDFAVVGIFEVIRHLPFFAKVRQTLLNAIEVRKPDLILLVDSGGFNIQFATAIRKRHKAVPIYYFISPQVWASRPWRIGVMKKAITKMLTVFPFEPYFYQKVGLDASFVGNTVIGTMEKPENFPSRDEFCRTHNLDKNLPIITVLPGSRKQEIRFHMPVVIDAIRQMNQLRPEIQFIISKSTTKAAPLVEKALKNAKLASICVVEQKDTLKAVNISDLAWAKSGTTTLEVTMLAKPMLIFYRANWLSYFMFLIFKTVKNIGWPNLLAGKTLVPELIQLDCRGEQLVKYSLDLFDVPALKAEITTELASMKNELGQGNFVDNTARELFQALESPAICLSKN
jgi:lipid-A-disaccharide synthase